MVICVLIHLKHSPQTTGEVHITYSSWNFPSKVNFTYRVSSLDRHPIEDLGVSVGVHGEEREGDNWDMEVRLVRLLSTDCQLEMCSNSSYQTTRTFCSIIYFFITYFQDLPASLEGINFSQENISSLLDSILENQTFRIKTKTTIIFFVFFLLSTVRVCLFFYSSPITLLIDFLTFPLRWANFSLRATFTSEFPFVLIFELVWVFLFSSSSILAAMSFTSCLSSSRAMAALLGLQSWVG